MDGSPRTPPPAPRKRTHNSGSPHTPSSIIQVGTQPPTPSAPARCRMRLNPTYPGAGAARNLLDAFEEARLQEEADEFHEEQDGEEQQVPTITFEYCDDDVPEVDEDDA